jgi:MOSC domain-containing protein YiiM
VIKENVTTSGIDLSSLKPGQILELGDQVVLEVHKVCLPCSRMEEVRPGLQQELEGRRGQLAAIVRGGAVEVGDQVRIREQAAVS